MRILITGGAGFVGSSLARAFQLDHPGAEITVLDNLHRRGSEINLVDFKRRGIRFQHGDIRMRGDLETLDGTFDVFIEASAEPSVLAGLSGSPSYLLESNLLGSLNCLELIRQGRAARTIFLSTSRVYAIEALRRIRLREGPRRFELESAQAQPGISEFGIDEDFSTREARSLYGATKLASELFFQEYAETYGVEVLINRCGVLAGPGQFGKVDQGVFTLWVANHVFGLPLKYIGYEGSGLQVRDLLHPLDLYALIQRQLEASKDHFRGCIYNVGGGVSGSVSLREMTELCRTATGRTVPIERVSQTTSVDIPYFVTDARRAQAAFAWRPARSEPVTIVREIHEWIRANEASLRELFGG